MFGSLCILKKELINPQKKNPQLPQAAMADLAFFSCSVCGSWSQSTEVKKQVSKASKQKSEGSTAGKQEQEL